MGAAPCLIAIDALPFTAAPLLPIWRHPDGNCLTLGHGGSCSFWFLLVVKKKENMPSDVARIFGAAACAVSILSWDLGLSVRHCLWWVLLYCDVDYWLAPVPKTGQVWARWLHFLAA